VLFERYAALVVVEIKSKIDGPIRQALSFVVHFLYQRALQEAIVGGARKNWKRWIFVKIWIGL